MKFKSVSLHEFRPLAANSELPGGRLEYHHTREFFGLVCRRLETRWPVRILPVYAYKNPNMERAMAAIKRHSS
jgi:hypothetical protein